MQIFVTNKNDFTHCDKFNGDEFIWEPGEKLLIDAEAASHMFGFGRADKTENLLRLGWVNLPNNEGVDRLRKFVFTDARVIEVLPDVQGDPIANDEEEDEDPVEVAKA